ncbi:Zn-ribbon domain-containing OB-fold protein [Paremcibacter congregatus]|nr:zinc ribbon domain-containing protein [Paremcibacter congregatus]
MTDLILPQCGACGTVIYPRREICPDCLSDDIADQTMTAEGVLLARVDLQHSLEPYFQDHMPWPTGTVQLKRGPVMIAHLVNGALTTGAAVDIQQMMDIKGRPVMVAVPLGSPTFTWADVEKGRQI